MTNKWGFQDELQRLAMSLMQNPPTSITELLDEFEQVLKPQPKSGSGFRDVVDDPRAEKEKPVANSQMTREIRLYTCPACQADVNGTATLDLADTVLPPTLNERGNFYVDLRLVGVRADAHNCGEPTVR